MILTAEAIHFLSSKKKIEFLRQIEANKDENNVPPVKLLTRDKVTFLVKETALLGSFPFTERCHCFL